MSSSPPTSADNPLADYESVLRGALLRPGRDGYDAARSVWNAMIDRHPALIARCGCADDVVHSIRFALRQGLPVAVRGGGHNIAGKGVCDGGLVIDFSPMNTVTVDPTARRVRVGGGATWADVDRETQRFGLATPGGVVSDTGVAGLTLGGGFGRLSRAFGLAADNLLSAELVTADGERLVASEEENPDLLWGLRGGGGNFGVVTALEFALHPVGPEVLFGPIFYPAGQARDVMRHYRDFAATVPRQCSVWMDCLCAPPLPVLPEASHGTPVVLVAPFFAGDPEEGEELLRPLRGFGEPLADLVSRQPYVDAQAAIDPLFEAGARNYWGSHNMTALTDAALDALAGQLEQLPTPESDILVIQLGGAAGDVAAEATAYPHRHVEFVITPGARWRDPADDARCIQWIRECNEALAPHAAGGSYVNFIVEDSGREREAYGTNYARLAQLKAKYDPGNVFRLNQNVLPGA